MSVTVPIAEIAVGVALLPDSTAPAAAALAAALFAAFAAAMIVNLIRGRSIDCGCLGVSAKTPVSWLLVTRNIALIATALSVTLAGADEPAAAAIVPSVVTAAAAAALLARPGRRRRSRPDRGRGGALPSPAA